MNSNRLGFTLIEVMAALMVVAMLLVVAAATLGNTRKRMAMDEVLAEIMDYHASARRRAKRTGRVVVLNITPEKLSQRFGDSASGSKPLDLVLADGYRIEDVKTGRSQVVRGVWITSSGRSLPVYIQVVSPSGERRRLMLGGLAGSGFELESDAEKQAILDLSKD